MTKNKTGDVCLSISIVIQQLLSVVQLFLGDVMIVSIEGAAFFRVVGTAFFVVLSFLWIVKRRILSLLSSYLIIALLFLWTLYISPNSIKYIQDEGVKFTCLTCIPVFLAMLSVKDMKIFHRMFYFICVLTALVGVLYGLLMFIGVILQEHYSMAFGYSLMLPIMYLVFQKSIFSISLAIVTSFSLIINGSRGPFIIIVAFLTWLFIHYITKKKIVILVTLSSFVILMYSYLDVIISVLSDFSIKSRVLKKLVEGGMSDPAGRESYYESGINKIIQSPIYGYGLYGDRMFYESYVHNIFLEFLIDFGIPVGCFTLFLLSIISLSRFCRLKGKDKDFFVLVAMGSIFPLFASGSYLISFSFFFFLGVLMRGYYDAKSL